MKTIDTLSRRAALVLAIGAVAFTTASRADTFPDKPVTLMVSAAAGGSSDITARAIAAGLQERWKQAVIVDNRAGANGLIGVQMLMKAAPDGYTLLLGSIGPMMLAPLQHGSKYDPDKAYTMIGQATTTYMVMVTANNAPYQDLRGYIAHAKRNQGNTSFSSSGIGSAMHIAGESLKQQSGANLTHIPYKGESPALVDLSAGTVSAGFVVAGTAVPLVQAGKMKALAISDAKRAPELPNVPTAKEQDFNLDMPIWNGIVGPVGMKPELVTKINHDLNEVLKSPTLQAQLQKIGISAAPSTPQGFASYVKAQGQVWRKIVQDGAIALD